MAIAKLYGQALVSAFRKEIDAGTDQFKIMLCANTYAPNQDTHRYKADVTSEVTGSGYTAGGAVLANFAISYDAATNTFKLDADDVAWNPSSITARYAVIYDATPGTDAVRPLLAYIDFEGDKTSSNDIFQIAFSASGIVSAVVA